MRLIVHPGLHKTGSTYLQHVMNLNHQPLLAAGVYYEKQTGYPAHHHAAWDLLRGESGRLAAMLQAGRAAGCHTVVFSSEDLEGAMFDPVAIEALEGVTEAGGVTAIEWHLCLRDPGEYFSSLYAQLQHHVFADATAMLFEVLRDGIIMMLDPLRGAEGTPYWCYCFDHERYITAFAERTGHSVFAHDYRDAEPYPGWRILECAGGLQAIGRLPGAEARNARMAAGAVKEGHCDQISRLVGSEEQRRLIMPMVKESVRRSAASVDRYAQVVSEMFAPGSLAVLRNFALPEATAPSKPLSSQFSSTKADQRAA